MRALVLALMLLPAPALAEDCRGVPSAYRCTAADGTVTQTRRLGPATLIEGKDPATGAAWSQRSVTAGRVTATTGKGADGARWQWHSQTIGGRTYTHGRDPKGRSFTQVCDRFRCY
jgi:hypothetical protein